MRLQKHLNEGFTSYWDTPLDDINSRIHQYCKTYLRLIKGKLPLYRGMETGNIDIGQKSVRKDRKPYGMDNDTARALNRMLQKNGHARRDKSVLVTSDEAHTEMFGKTYFVFPKDKMKYTWIEVPDINMVDALTGWNPMTLNAWILIDLLNGATLNPKMFDMYADALDDLKKPFENHFHTNKGFNTAYKNEFEMWIETDSYYFADSKLYHWHKNKQELFL